MCIRKDCIFNGQYKIDGWAIPSCEECPYNIDDDGEENEDEHKH